MKLFDLHCDTATRLLAEKQPLYDNSLHISIKRAEYLEKYAQVMAIWTNYKLTDEEGYYKFFEVLSNLENEVEINRGRVALVKNDSELSSSLKNSKASFIISVEDARILSNDLNRLDVLYAHGVRALTLNWYGETCIGGAHDTNVGLSKFGIEVVKKCFDLGIVPDISHSSFKGAFAALELAEEYKKPIIASHSDSYTINSHTRNLSDGQFRRIIDLNGLVGINLCPSHLSSDEKADINDVMHHMEHYLSLGGENVLSMGGDLDGTDLPCGFSGIEHIYKIADEMQRLNYSTELVENIMFNNAYKFFTKHL